MWSSTIPVARRAGTSLIVAAMLAPGPAQLSGQIPAAGPSVLEVRHTARSLQPGEVIALEVSAPLALRSLDVLAFDRQVPMWPDTGRRLWKAIVGVDVEVGAGRYEMQFLGQTVEGGQATAVHPIDVTPKAFAERHLRVDPRFSDPPESVRPRIAQEAARLETIFTTLSRSVMLVLPLAAPVPQRASSPFGSRSFFNRLPRSRHNGVDFASPAGTEVRAPAEGRVVLVGDLYFTGNTVVVDHGFGVYSLFAHLERMAARDGVDVERGELLGWVGATGRATGPHLHWSVRVHGARVDPLSLLYAGPRAGA